MSRIIRSFFQTVGLINRGRVEEKLNDHLEKAIAAVEQHPDEKVSADITLKITVTKLGDRIDVKATPALRLPKDKAFPSATFWALEGGLSVEHPNQSDMFTPREVRPRDFA